MKLDAILSPAELALLPERKLEATASVVFDILRATTTFVTALAHGAKGILPVCDIIDALAAAKHHPDSLLAGEREGVRITAEQTGTRAFDLGNSPREFTRERISGRSIISTTTNGTRALQACRPSACVLASSFLNLDVTSEYLISLAPQTILLVASGTGTHPALEDVLAVGALAARITRKLGQIDLTDAARIALALHTQSQGDILTTLQMSRNGKRLMNLPGLRDDVAFCAQADTHPIVARMDEQGWLKTVR